MGEGGEEASGRTVGVQRLARKGESAQAEMQNKHSRAMGRTGKEATHAPFFGLTLVNGELGDLRQSPQGILLYTANGRQELPLGPLKDARIAVLEEWADAVRNDRRPVHDARWGRATLEICSAVMESSAKGAEVRLGYQAPAESPPTQRGT